MSKALEEVKTLRGFNQVELNNDENINKSLDIIEQALQRLESIDNAKSSEALGCLQWMGVHRIEYSEYSMPIKDISEYNTIKQYILKVQEQEELLDYLIKFIKNVEVSDNGIYYVSFKNNTPYLNCIEIDKDHYNKVKKLKRYCNE